MITLFKTGLMLTGLYYIGKTFGNKIQQFNYNVVAPAYNKYTGKLTDPANDSGVSYAKFSICAGIAELALAAIVVIAI